MVISGPGPTEARSKQKPALVTPAPAVVAVVVMVIVSLVAGCGESRESTETVTPDQSSADTTVTTATTGPTSSSTSASTSASQTTGSATDGAGPSDLGAEGSGCSPGDSEALPDGRWFGYFGAADTAGFAFDLACWFTGPAAVAASADDGEESPPPNDFYIRNRFDVLRLLTVSPSATIAALTDAGDPATASDSGYEAWVAQRGDQDQWRPGWVVVKEGLVVSIEEQYIP